MSDLRTRMADTIVGFEARRDKAGKLTVYRLPAGDGGGSYEVAGINDRYHPDEAAHLAQLVGAGRQDEAEAYVDDFIARYTDVVVGWTANAGTEFYLRDSVFNRGPKGAARILQRAIGVKDDGVIGPLSRAAIATVAPEQLLPLLRHAREEYEREVDHRDESSPFWAGLVHRWDNALAAAQRFAGEPLEAPPAAEPSALPATLPRETWPRESDELDAFYGNPRGVGGGPSPVWERANLVDFSPPWHMGAPLRVHRKVVASLTAVCRAIWDHYGHEDAAIAKVRMNRTGGAYNFRPNRNNAAKLSVHSYGAAIDFDPDDNENGHPWTLEQAYPNGHMMPVFVIQAFKAAGWAWGGDFSGTKDAMHFQATWDRHHDEAPVPAPPSTWSPTTPPAPPVVIAPPIVPEPPAFKPPISPPVVPVPAPGPALVGIDRIREVLLDELGVAADLARFKDAFAGEFVTLERAIAGGLTDLITRLHDELAGAAARLAGFSLAPPKPAAPPLAPPPAPPAKTGAATKGATPMLKLPSLINWQTTLLGVAAGLTAAAHLANALAHGDISALATDVPGILAGFGLVKAADAK